MIVFRERMEWLFGKKMTPDEMLRKNQRALTKVFKFTSSNCAQMVFRIFFINKFHSNFKKVYQLLVEEF